MLKPELKSELRLNYFLIFLKIAFVVAMVLTYFDKTI